ncbi:hypothetical protein ACFX15_018457 [Malus domestica]
MVPSFSNPGFPHVHTHPTRLPAMDARLSVAIDSFEASMRAAIRDAIHAALDSTLTAIHKVVTPVLADIRSDLAQLHRDLALGVEGDSDPASLCSEEAASIEVGHQKPHNGDGNPLRIPSTIHDHSIPPLLLSSPMLRALANSTIKPHSNKSAASTILLPESKTMISTPQLLHKHSFSATTKTGPEDKGRGSTFNKMQLKRAVARIKLLRNKGQVVVKQMRRDIALLLQSGKNATTRIRVEYVIREHNTLVANEFIELFYELVVSRLFIIAEQWECPPGLKEGIASLIFASPRCSEISKLIALTNVFEKKHGKDFVSTAVDVHPSYGVNRMLIDKLSVRIPMGEVKLKLLKEIAKEYHIEWDTSKSEL